MGDGFAWLVTTALFGLWHLGYADVILWRTAYFQKEIEIVQVMFWKMITGLLFGIVLGTVRYKWKNVYAPALVHCLLNIFGR